MRIHQIVFRICYIQFYQYNLQRVNMNLKDFDFQSEDDKSYPQQTNNQQVEADPQQIVEKVIFERQLEEQKKHAHIKILSEDVQFKLQDVLDDIKDCNHKNFQQIISLRMKQLAYNKILVLTYQKSSFRLVQALFHIAKQYLKFDCFEQAMHHLQNAIVKNVKAGQNLNNKLYHSYILSSLGQCYFRCGHQSKALQQLNKALNIQTEYEQANKQLINNIRTLVQFSKVKTALNHQDVVQKIQQAVLKARQLKGARSRTYGLVLYEQAKIYIKKQEKQEALKLYEMAIEAIKISNQLQFQEDIIKIYKQMADIYESMGNTIKHIEILKQRFQVFEDTYGNADKKTIKEQRTIATVLLKYQKIDQSLEEFDDILEKEQKVFGQNSLEVGKQYKVIANIYGTKKNTKQAQKNYRKAQKIFHDLGDQRAVRQINTKLAALQNRYDV